MTLNVSAYSGSPTISTTEVSLPNAGALSPLAVVGMFQLFLDLAALAAGDQFVLKVYEKTVAGGTQRVLYSTTFSGIQATPGHVEPPLLLGVGWDMTLQRTAGADRVIPFSIRSVS